MGGLIEKPLRVATLEECARFGHSGMRDRGLLPPIAGGAPAFVQGNHNGTSSTVTTLAAAYTSNVTAGNLLVCGGNWLAGNGNSVTDTQGNTWTPSTATAGGAGYFDSSMSYNIGLWYTVAGSTGANTVTLHLGNGGGTSFVRIFILEYSGADTYDKDSASNSAAGSATSFSYNIVTANANSVVVVVPAWNSGTPSAGSGYSLRETDSGQITYDQEIPAAGTVAVTGSNSTSTKWMSIAAAFYSSGAAPAATPDKTAMTWPQAMWRSAYR